MGKSLSDSHKKNTELTTPRLPNTKSVVSTEKRDDIVREAFHVYYAEGFHATGVDRVLEGTGISKRTLYKYFDSKEELIRTTIAYYANRQSRLVETYLESHRARSPVDKALGIFDWLAETVAAGHAFGCYAMNAQAEYAQKDDGIEEACAMHFARFERLFTDFAKECGAKHPKRTAMQLRTVFQGAITLSQSTRDVAVAQNAKAVAKLILENAR